MHIKPNHPQTIIAASNITETLWPNNSTN